MLGDWHYLPRYVAAPPLSELQWIPLERGVAVPAWSLILTDRNSSVELQIPLAAYTPDFIAEARNGRRLGFTVKGDEMEVEIDAQTLYPLRRYPGVNIPRVTIMARIVDVSGVAIVATQHDVIRQKYAKLEPHNPPYPESERLAPPPDLGPAPVHLRHGLGIRGKSLSQVDPRSRQLLHLEGVDGFYIDAVLPDSPAERGGLKAHDVIISVNGIAIRNARDLATVMQGPPQSQPLTIAVRRFIVDAEKSRELTRQVTPGEVNGDANVLPESLPTALPAGSPGTSPAQKHITR